MSTILSLLVTLLLLAGCAIQEPGPTPAQICGTAPLAFTTPGLERCP